MRGHVLDRSVIISIEQHARHESAFTSDKYYSHVELRVRVGYVHRTTSSRHDVSNSLPKAYSTTTVHIKYNGHRTI